MVWLKTKKSQFARGKKSPRCLVRLVATALVKGAKREKECAFILLIQLEVTTPVYMCVRPLAS